VLRQSGGRLFAFALAAPALAQTGHLPFAFEFQQGFVVVVLLLRLGGFTSSIYHDDCVSLAMVDRNAQEE